MAEMKDFDLEVCTIRTVRWAVVGLPLTKDWLGGILVGGHDRLRSPSLHAMDCALGSGSPHTDEGLV